MTWSNADTQTVETTRSRAIIVTLFIIITLAIAPFAVYQYTSTRDGNAGTAPLSGLVYLSLIPLPTKPGEASTVGIYEYNFASRQIYKTLVDENANMTPSYREGEPQVLFSSRKKSGVAQIELYDSRVKLPPFPLTNSSTINKRLPMWSPDKKSFVFTAHSQKMAPTPNDWDVYMYALTTEKSERPFSDHDDRTEKRITSGYSPIFSHDGASFIYLKNDGIYAIPLRGGIEKKLVTGVSDLSSRFSVSDDGTLLVWTRPEEKTVEIYTITEDLSLTLRSQHNTSLFDPHFITNEHIVGVSDSKAFPGFLSLFAYDLRADTQTELLALRLFDRNKVYVSEVRH